MELSIVVVTLVDRDDEGLFVHSDDLPGLILTGKDKRAVCDAIIPAIEAIMRHKGCKEVTVRSEKPLHEALALPSPRRVPMHVQRFVVEFKLAA